MKILLIKMSSMGDVFHALPALNDAIQAIPGLEVDWVVEKGFSEIPAWHPSVRNVFSIELRRWRKHPIKNRHVIRDFFEKINQHQYDLVLDAQGLLKSAWVGRKIHAPVFGMGWHSAREPLASLFYQKKFSVDKSLHAITRQRKLFAQALSYDLDASSELEYGLNVTKTGVLEVVGAKPDSYFVCIHGTTWKTKLWPEDYWVALIEQVIKAGYQVVLPWGTPEEHERSLWIRQQVNHNLDGLNQRSIYVPQQRHSLSEMAVLLKSAKQVVSVDTGLSHVAAALAVPMTVLYRVTSYDKVGAIGSCVTHLSSPLSKNYLKVFSGNQAEDSLQNLSVSSVAQSIDFLSNS